MAPCCFVLVSVKTLCAVCEEASIFYRFLGYRIAAATSEPRLHQFLMQGLSVTLQSGNAVYVLGPVPVSIKLDELLYFVGDLIELHALFC